MEEKSASDQLNVLLKRNYDAEKGFEQAYENIKNEELKPFLKNSKEERYRFGHEIKDLLSEIGAEPDKGSTLEASAHRAWMNVKEVLSLNTDAAILEECERGEEYALKDYDEAITNHNLSMKMREQLSEHLHAIRNSKDQLGKLEITA